MNNSKSTEQRFNESIEQLKAQDIDSHDELNLQKRIKIAVTQEAQRLEKLNAEQQPQKMKSSFAQMLSGLKSKLVYAGSSAFAVGFIGFMVIMGGTSQSAFAKVQEQLVSVENLFYQSKMYVQQQPIMQISVWFQQPGNVRVETQPLTANAEQAKSINLIDTDQGKGLILFPGNKLAMPFEFDAGAASDPKQNPLHWFDVVKDYQGEVVELEQRMLDGQLLNGHLIKESGITIELWSSSDTNLPQEISIYDGETIASSSFRMLGRLTFNQPLDLQLFKLEVPAGYQTAGQDNN